MRIHHALLMLLAVAGLLALPVCAARVADAETALQAAGQKNQDILVFYHGSDWNAAGEKLKAVVWDLPSMEAALPAVCLLSIDMVDKPTDEQKKTREKTQKKLLDVFNPWNYPAIALFDSKGRLVAKQEGLKATMSAPELVAKVKEFVTLREQRDQLWQRAEQAGDPYAKAAALGKGLAVLDYKIARQREYHEIIKRIKELDKENRTGYAEVYEFNTGAFVEGQIFPIKQKSKTNHQEVLDSLETMERNAVRPVWQKQEILAMKYALYACWDGHAADATDCLNKIVALDPDSDAAIGAKHLLEPGVAKSCWMNDAFK